MKQMVLPATLLGLAALLATSQAPAPREKLTVAELRQREVIGELGVPLGTAVEIEAEIVAA